MAYWAMPVSLASQNQPLQVHEDLQTMMARLLSSDHLIWADSCAGMADVVVWELGRKCHLVLPLPSGLIVYMKSAGGARICLGCSRSALSVAKQRGGTGVLLQRCAGGVRTCLGRSVRQHTFCQDVDFPCIYTVQFLLCKSRRVIATKPVE